MVRLHLMRNTVHLVSARDCLDWRALFYPLHAAEFRARFRAGVEGVDLDALLRRTRQLLEEQPRTRAELGRAARGAAGRTPTRARWRTRRPTTSRSARCHPAALWGKAGPAAWAPVETWLGAPLRTVPVDALVLRYLGAFGPATVADIQTWSGLTRLGEVVERLAVRPFRGPAGQTLYDLPDAPRPPEDLPAPPRFLPEYDNLLLSHKDRTRVIRDNRPVPLPPGNGATSGTFLVDGRWQGTWQVRDRTLRIQPFTRLAAATAMPCSPKPNSWVRSSTRKPRTSWSSPSPDPSSGSGPTCARL